MTEERKVEVFPDPEALARGAAQLLVDRARDAIADHGAFRVALSGGNTPRLTYETLAQSPFKEQVEWDKVQVFFSDERWVPSQSPDSNYHLAWEALLSKVPIPDRFVHRIDTAETPPGESAALYAQGVRRVFEVGLTAVPHFDLIFLGVGEDGHTASLFPGTQALSDAQNLVAANFVERIENWRITFTFTLIDAARCVAFLVAGAYKADVVGRVLGGADLPAGKISLEDGRLLWLLDSGAAAALPADVRPST